MKRREFSPKHVEFRHCVFSTVLLLLTGTTFVYGKTSKNSIEIREKANAVFSVNLQFRYNSILPIFHPHTFPTFFPTCDL